MYAHSHYTRIVARIVVFAAVWLVAILALSDLWTINTAGLTLNKYAATRDHRYLEWLARRETDLARLSHRSTISRASAYRTYGYLASLRPLEDNYSVLLAGNKKGALDAFGQLWLGEVAAATGHWKQAELSYRSVDAGNILAYRAEQAAARGELEQASHWYDAALSSLEALQLRVGPSRDVAICLGRIAGGYERINESKKAFAVYHRALALIRAADTGSQERAEVYFGLARQWADKQPIDDIEARTQKGLSYTYTSLGLQAFPGPWSKVCAAHIYIRLGQRRLAVRSLEQAIARDPSFRPAYLLLGQILEEDGLPSLARDLYGEALKHIKGDPMLLAAQATLAYKTMSPQSALPYLEAAATDTCQDPYVFAYLAECLARTGKMREATAVLMRGFRQTPGEAALIARAKLLGQWRRYDP